MPITHNCITLFQMFVICNFIIFFIICYISNKLAVCYQATFLSAQLNVHIVFICLQLQI